MKINVVEHGWAWITDNLNYLKPKKLHTAGTMCEGHTGADISCPECGIFCNPHSASCNISLDNGFNDKNMHKIWYAEIKCGCGCMFKITKEEK